MATITTNTTITLPAGQMLVFGLGGSATAIIDGNVYDIGQGEKFFGPFTQSESVQVVVRSGTITYNIETDGAASREITQDPISRQLTTDSADAVRAAVGVANSAKGGRRGMRFPFGRYATLANDASGRTHHIVMDLPAGADELILVACNNQTAQVVELQAVACAMANLNNINNSDGSAGAWSGMANWADNNANSSVARVPLSASTARLKYILSEPIAITTPDRTDGGSGALVGIRFFMRTSIPTYTVFGNGGSDDFSGWVNRADGRTLIMRSQVGQHVLPTTGFNSTTNEKQSPIAGVIFLARGQVVNVVRFGDSIMDGRGTAIGDGYMGPACLAASREVGVTVCDSNLAWAGTASATHSQHALDFIGSFAQYIDVVAYSSGTPNDVSGTPITSAIVAGARRNAARVIDAAARQRIAVIVPTWAPTNPASNDWNSSDSLRRDYVDYVKASTDVHVVDTSSVWAGPIDADGQQQMAPGVTSDNIHPNDTGNALAAPLATDAIVKCVRKTSGL
jgi:GDSL-like Lipase/Acylhydrolase family